MRMMFALLLLTTNPAPDVLRESYCVIERNEVWTLCEDEPPRFNFAQILFRNFDWHRGTHEIEAWRMTRSGDEKRDRITLIRHGHGVTATWMDGDKLRVVEGGSYRETAADFDIEVIERERLPGQRRDLRQPVQGRRELR